MSEKAILLILYAFIGAFLGWVGTSAYCTLVERCR